MSSGQGRHHWRPPSEAKAWEAPAYQLKNGDDAVLLEKLLGLNETGRPKPSLADKYPSEWRELHKSQETIEYEAKIARLRTKVHVTKYGKEWDKIHKPITGHWTAKTPLYDQICRSENTVPEVSPPKYNTSIPRKRAGLRLFTAKEMRRTMSFVKRRTANAFTLGAKYAAGRESSVNRDSAAGRGVPKKRHRMVQEPEFPLVEPKHETRPVHSKRTFFRLPGNAGPRRQSKADDTIASQLRHAPGVRTTVARRLFGQRAKAPAPHRVGARTEDTGLDELAYNTEHKVRKGPRMGGKVTLFIQSEAAPAIVIGESGNVSKFNFAGGDGAPEPPGVCAD